MKCSFIVDRNCISRFFLLLIIVYTVEITWKKHLSTLTNYNCVKKSCFENKNHIWICAIEYWKHTLESINFFSSFMTLKQCGRERQLRLSNTFLNMLLIVYCTISKVLSFQNDFNKANQGIFVPVWDLYKRLLLLGYFCLI